MFSNKMSLVSRFKTSIELFFFPLLFSGYCRSAGHRVVSIISGCCNQSSFVLFYVVDTSICVHAVFNTGKSSSSFSS